MHLEIRLSAAHSDVIRCSARVHQFTKISAAVTSKLMQVVDPLTRDIDRSRFCPLRAVLMCTVQVILGLRASNGVTVWQVTTAVQLFKVNG